MNTDAEPRTYAIIGAAMEVHNQLGHGFLEPVYQEALAVELARRAIPFEREPELPIFYKGTRLQCSYRPDFVCYGDILVELKALSTIGGIEHAQVINYLKITGFRLGLLLNFGVPKLEIKRMRLDPHLCKSVQSVNLNKPFSPDSTDFHREE